MPPVSQKLTPLKGTDFDSSELYVQDMFAVFMKNITNIHLNEFVFPPLISNTKYCELDLPAGDNYCVGFKYFKKINRAFVCVWNSNSNHLVYQISGLTGACTILAIKSCFNFQLDPVHFFAQSRMEIQTSCRFNKKTGLQEEVIFLVMTDDYNDQRMICVDDCIATHGFDKLLFPYFNVNDDDCDECSYFNLGLAPNKDCIVVTPVDRNLTDPNELLKHNKINYKAWEFRIKWFDVWNRDSLHGPISTKYINSIGGTCVQESTGLARCVKLKFSAGCPIIDKIQIEFRNCSGNIRGLSVDSDWFKADLLEKYNDCDNNNWWERSINDDGTFTYNPEDNTIEYVFCADKECQPIDVKETNKVTNFLPLTSGAVFGLGKNIALAKNTRGFEPLDCKELDKMKFTIEKPVANPTCLSNQLRKITIWGIIWNPQEDVPVPIRKDSDNIIFGVATCANNNPVTFGQVLPVKQEGIIGYLAGTSHYNISHQYKYDSQTGDKTLVGLNFGTAFDGLNLRYYPFQKWEFNVLPGKYVFRIASHQATPIIDFQATSTYTIGRTAINSLGHLAEETKEIIVDACSGDVEILDAPMMIFDLTRIGKGCSVVDVTSVNTGYLYEDEIDKVPIELASVQPSPYQGFFTRYTDHNGFYFASTRARGLHTSLYGTKNCVQNVKLAESRTSYDDRDAWYRFDKLYAYKNLDKYPSKDRIKIKGKISLCDNINIGVAGALVVLTRGLYATTNSKGEFTIVAHDNGTGSVRIDDIIYSQKGTCQLLQCSNNCNNCFQEAIVSMPICDGNDRVVTVNTLSVRINGYNRKGPHMGGRYGIGLVLHDWLDRLTYVEIEEKHYINIPSLQETQVYDFSKILFDINGMIFPKWVRRVSFYITEDLTEDDYLTWVAERVQFVDNTGKLSPAPTKIRLYYEGLNEYNKQNDYSTNAVWNFYIDKVAQTVVTGDLVEVLANGDGVIYPNKISELVTYDAIGKYIQIAYREELKDLKDGALIKLIRQKQCVQKEFFYEVCPIIPVKDRKAVNPIGQLDYFDAYILNRQIPIPVTTTTKTTDANNNVIETSVTENELRNFPFLFEHHSPSDFWGDHCGVRGRVNVRNPLENKQCRSDEICISRALTEDGLLNGLHRFNEEDAIYIGQQWTAIVACIVEATTVMVICENYTMLIPFNDSNVKADASGRVVVPSLDDKLGSPQKERNFGCQPWDINTIRAREGVVMFLDSNNAALVKHNYSEPIDVSNVGAKNYIASNVKAMIRNNTGDSKKLYSHGLIDPKTNVYYLTFARLHGASEDYINDTREISYGINDTLLFDIKDNQFRGTVSFTPEYYGWMDGEKDDQQMFSFRFAQGWAHNRLNNVNPIYCNFYDTQCTPVFEFVINKENDKVKAFTSFEIYCKEVLLYADRILTESGQVSRIMPLWWEKRDKFWVADFKCATNTQVDVNMPIATGPNALLDGDSLYGRWLRIRLIPKLNDRSKYFELTSVIGWMFGKEKSGA